MLDLSNYATKKKSKDAADVDTSNLSAKREIITLNIEANKLDINKLVNVPSSVNNLKPKVGNLDIYKSQTVPVGLKKKLVM